MAKVLDFVKPGVVTGEDLNKIFEICKEHKAALPAVNCVGSDSVNGVIEAAANVGSPVLFSSQTVAVLSTLVRV